jgi:adenylate cyclase
VAGVEFVAEVLAQDPFRMACIPPFKRKFARFSPVGTFRSCSPHLDHTEGHRGRRRKTWSVALHCWRVSHETKGRANNSHSDHGHEPDVRPQRGDRVLTQSEVRANRLRNRVPIQLPRYFPLTRRFHMAEDRAKRRLAAILAADVVGYSRLMQLDETGALAVLKSRRSEVLQPVVSKHHGRIIKLMGDGALIEFASAVNAVECAVQLQHAMETANGGLPPERRIVLRIGINLGDVVVEGSDLYGDGVNIAARLEALAEPASVFVSETVFNHVRGKVSLGFADLGEQTLKNIAEPVRVYRVNSTSPTVPVVSSSADAKSPKPSIAVLPFTNMSVDPEQDYFSDGICEDIITDLSKLSELHVIARNSSFVFKGRAVSIPEVARTLDVRHVLEGSVRKAGNRVRVTAQLIDATTGGHLWADRYDRDLTDIFTVQDELTREIVSALKIKLTMEEKGRLVHKRAIDFEAYDLFLRGREQALNATRGGNVEARKLLGRAIAIDPDYAAAHGYIGFTHLNDYVNGWADVPEQSLKIGLEIAARAVAMDPEDAHAHFALSVAFLWHREHDRALAEAQRCLALAPNLASGHMAIARIQIYCGNAEDAIRTINAYMRLDPLYPVIALHFLAEAHLALGHFEEAVAALKQRLERDSNSETSYALLASCYGHLGKIAESQAAWAEVKRIAPDFSIERRRRVLPFNDPDFFERQVEGLRKADLPI